MAVVVELKIRRGGGDMKVVLEAQLLDEVEKCHALENKLHSEFALGLNRKTTKIYFL